MPIAIPTARSDALGSGKPEGNGELSVCRLSDHRGRSARRYVAKAHCDVGRALSGRWSWRDGQALNALEMRRNWRLSAGALRSLQETRLRRMVRHAYDQVPYYRTLFDAAGLRPQDIRTLDDLAQIPLTTKQDLRVAGPRDVIARSLDPAACRVIHTSGTSGRPFAIYLSPQEASVRRWAESRAMSIIGRHWWELTVVLGPESERRTPLHQRLGIQRTRVIRGDLPPVQQEALLRSSHPHVLWAYPTHLTAVLHRVAYRLSEIARPRILVTSSGPLEPWLRERIRADCDPEVFNWYGCMEVGRIAFECPAHEGLHVNSDHLLLEIVADGKPVAPGRPGTVVLTALNCYTMPLLRYVLGDTSRLLPSRCSCGSAFTLIGPPVRRLPNLMVLPSGALRSADLTIFVLRAYQWIERFLMIQQDRSHLLLQLQTRAAPPEGALDAIRARFNQQLGEPMNLEIEIVEVLADEGPYESCFLSKLPDWRPVSTSYQPSTGR